MELNQLYGRRLVVAKCDLPADLPSAVQVLPTMIVGKHNVRCLRCNAVTASKFAWLPRGQYYCPQCINLGRVSTLDCFYHVAEPNQFPPTDPILTWQGHLSPLQRHASLEVSEGFAKHERRLLWAVTGAGKTEMLFAGLAECLQRGERVAIASPRVDVCLELYPRLSQAFANVPIALLHGRSKERYQYRQLTICTTHQLLRFYHAFDNLIVDEVDAFPYAMNPQLLFATQQAVKPHGGTLFLTATPGTDLQRQIRRGQLKASYLPLRYHGHLLPVIHLHLAPSWRQKIHQKRLPTSLLAELRPHLKSGQRFLLFVPHVTDLALVAAAINHELRPTKYALVHATDEQRLAKVQGMRDGHYQFLITTTILERGVTFPGIDVFVIGADDQIFSTSALVQIAGRAGRSPDRPDGLVGFWCAAYAGNVKAAVKQIRQLNRRGAKLRKEINHG